MELRATGEATVYQRMVAQQDFYLGYMEQRAAAAWAAMAQVIGTGSGIGGRMAGSMAQATPFADGGSVTSTGYALLHAGEVVYTPIRPAGREPLSSSSTISNNMGGITLQIKGVTRAQIKQEVNAELDYLFDKAGM